MRFLLPVSSHQDAEERSEQNVFAGWIISSSACTKLGDSVSKHGLVSTIINNALIVQFCYFPGSNFSFPTFWCSSAVELSESYFCFDALDQSKRKYNHSSLLKANA